MTIYSIETPDDKRTYHAHKATALGRARHQSYVLKATVVVRAHMLAKLKLRELACELLNGGGFNDKTETVIGWYSNGNRHKVLEGRTVSDDDFIEDLDSTYEMDGGG